MKMLQRNAIASSVFPTLALTLSLFSSSSLAQKADLPDVKAGDQWSFAVYSTVPSTTPNRTWVITSVTAVAIEGTENGDPLS